MTLTTTTGTYTHPRTFGQYPNAYIEYSGEKHYIDGGIFDFRFSLMTENDELIQEVDWRFEGTTPKW